MTSTSETRLSPPGNEIPVALAVNLVLGRGPGVAVLLPTVYIYTTGMQLQVQVQVREGLNSSTLEPLEAMSGRLGSSHEIDDQHRLLLSAKFADGRSAIVPSHGYSGLIRRRLSEEPHAASLTMGAGVGGPGAVLAQYWLRPLPHGPMILLCSWAAAHITKTTTMIDAGEIADAAGRVVVLWPAEKPGSDTG